MKISFICLFVLLQALVAADMRIYVGSYAKGAEAKGIHVLNMNSETGELSLLSSENSGPNPSFLTIHPDGKTLYAVNEMSEMGGMIGGALSAFRIDAKTGGLSLLNRHATTGGWPCHLNLDPMNQMIAVANYGGGSVTAYRVNQNGSLGAFSSFIQHEGSSVHERQKSPHAHSFDFSKSGSYAYSADLGIDKVVVYKVEAEKGKLIPHPMANLSLPAGYGPRHIAFTPAGDRLFVINELSSMLSSYIVEDEVIFKEVGHYPTLPEGFKGKSTTAEVMVHPNGKYVYASNRGHDSLAGFKIKEDGSLDRFQLISVEGKTPRNFAISPGGEWLLVAHQNSDSIRVFKLDPKTGKLELTPNQVALSKPVCIVFE